MNKGAWYKIFLIVLFLSFWTWAAINPTYREGWLTENYLVFIFVPIILVVGYYFRLSNISYTFITIFMILHVIGSHTTYAEVPFGYTLQMWFGSSRNMYDRLVHFSFGLLMAYPLREIFVRISKVKGVWGFYLPIDIVLAFSAVYEIIEWLAGVTLNPQAGLAFLGIQGDIWDSQKDMLMAGLGAITSMSIAFLANVFFNKGFKHELKDSLRPRKDDKPLGEEKIKSWLKH